MADCNRQGSLVEVQPSLVVAAEIGFGLEQDRVIPILSTQGRQDLLLFVEIHGADDWIIGEDRVGEGVRNLLNGVPLVGSEGELLHGTGPREHTGSSGTESNLGNCRLDRGSIPA
jgi:hypothetical protein